MRAANLWKRNKVVNLLPNRDFQRDTQTLVDGVAFISEEQAGHWYSPNAVARLIEEERREERERLQRIAEAAQEVTTGGEDHTDHFVVPSHLMAALALALDEVHDSKKTADAINECRTAVKGMNERIGCKRIVIENPEGFDDE